MKKPVPPRLRKFPAAKQKRLDHLLEKNSEGNITSHDAAALKQLVAVAEELMVANAKRLAAFFKTQTTGALPGSMPVTVWVQPQPQHSEP